MKQAGQVIEITIFTDPLCCWSWAFQPQLQQLKQSFGLQALWHYRMGGLIPSWENFHDEINSVTRPAQMGPVWMHAGQVMHMPINHQLWIKDPPASSYPACVAVKCAQLQSQTLGVLLFDLLQQACMVEGLNIAKQTVIFDIVQKLASKDKLLSVMKFENDYFNDPGIDAFRSDLALVRSYNINRFPTLIVNARDSKAIMISGYRAYHEVIDAVKVIAPEINTQLSQL